MRQTKKLSLKKGIDDSECSVTVKELTVAEIRSWLMDEEREKIISKKDSNHNIAVLLFKDITLYDLAFVSDLELKDMMDFTPSELMKLFKMAKELNESFFQLLTHLAQVSQQAS